LGFEIRDPEKNSSRIRNTVWKLGCDFVRICRQGKYEKALEDANLTIDVKPDWGKGYFRRGMALYSLGMFFCYATFYWYRYSAIFCCQALRPERHEFLPVFVTKNHLLHNFVLLFII
jgi:hypothetical protein